MPTIVFRTPRGSLDHKYTFSLAPGGLSAVNMNGAKSTDADNSDVYRTPRTSLDHKYTFSLASGGLSAVDMNRAKSTDDETGDVFRTPRTSLDHDSEHDDIPDEAGHVSAASGLPSSKQVVGRVTSADSSSMRDSQYDGDVFGFKTPPTSIILDEPDFPGGRSSKLGQAMPSVAAAHKQSGKYHRSQSDGGSLGFGTPPESPEVQSRISAAEAKRLTVSTDSAGAPRDHKPDEEEEGRQAMTGRKTANLVPARDHKRGDEDQERQAVTSPKTVNVVLESHHLHHKPEPGSDAALPTERRNAAAVNCVNEADTRSHRIQNGKAHRLAAFIDSRPSIQKGERSTPDSKTAETLAQIPFTSDEDDKLSEAAGGRYVLDVANDMDLVSSGQSLPSLHLPMEPGFVSSDACVEPPRLMVANASDVDVCSDTDMSLPTSPVREGLPQHAPALFRSAGKSGQVQDGSGTQSGGGIIDPKEADRTNKKKKKTKKHKKMSTVSYESDEYRSHRTKLSNRLNSFNLKLFNSKREKAGFSYDSDYKLSSSSSSGRYLHRGSRKFADAHSSSSDSDSDAGGPHRAFVNADTLRPSPLETGVHVHSTLMSPPGGASYEEDMTAKEILDKLDELSSSPEDFLHRALKLTLLTKTLPRAVRRQDLVSVSLCLEASDRCVRRSAGQSLEKMLMEDMTPQQSSADIMMKVMKKVLGALNSCRYSQKDAISQYSHLLLLAACVLLCHRNLSPNADSVREDIACFIYPKLSDFMKEIELNPTSREYLLLKGLLQFLKDLPTALTSRWSFHQADWEERLQSATGDCRREMDQNVRRANFAQLIQLIFSLTKEVRRRAEESYVWILTKEIKKTLKAVTKRSLNDQLSATFHFFLVRCLRLIITSSFREDQQEIGEKRCLSAGKVVRLLVAVVKNVSTRHQEMLQEEIRHLSFHQSAQVRKEMTEFTRDTAAMVELSLSYAEDHLHVAGLRPQRISSEENTQPATGTTPDKKQFGCTWKECEWRGGGDRRVLLQGAMCHPTQKCLSSTTAHDCVNHAEPQQRSHQHQNHLQMLVELGDHEQFLCLLAFQISPRPCFYITEKVNKQLISLLIDERTAQRWLRPTVLLGAAKQIAKALEFLASKGIALRDVTTFNMACLPTKGKHDEVKDVRVKLVDLGLAGEYLSTNKSEYYENRDIRRLRDPGPIPIRWTSWEALFEGIFSSASMVYAFGYVLYELFTHGCWPFTEMGSRSTADIFQAFYRRSQCVRVFQWPCFSDDVYQLIRECTEMKSEDRPDIKTLQQRIQTLLDQAKRLSCGPAAGSILRAKSSKNESYPPISLYQLDKKHVPEKEIPVEIHQLIKGDPNNYKNLRQSAWSSTDASAVTEAELIPVDACSIDSLISTTIVQEQFTKRYIKDVLPDVECGPIPGISEWTASPSIIVTERIYRRQYEPSMTLLHAAIRLGPDRGRENVQTRSLLHVLLELAIVVKGLHARGWLHCDLRACYVLLTRDDCKVSIGRIGRMLKLPHGATSVFLPPERNCSDSARWCAPEVLHNRIVRKESDVFMLSTVIWEVFNARQKCHVDPTAESSPTCFVPFPDAECTDIPSMVQEGVMLPAVLEGEEFGWVNELIYDCRNPDCDSRPSIDEVVDLMQAHCTLSRDDVVKTFRRPASVYSVVSSGNEPPALPKRQKLLQTFRASFRRTFANQRASVAAQKEGKDTPSLLSKAMAVTGWSKSKAPRKKEGKFYKLGYLSGNAPAEDQRCSWWSSTSSVVEEIYEVCDFVYDTWKPEQNDARPSCRTKSSSAGQSSNVFSRDDDDLSPIYIDPEKDPKIGKSPHPIPSKDVALVPRFPSEYDVKRPAAPHSNSEEKLATGHKEEHRPPSGRISNSGQPDISKCEDYVGIVTLRRAKHDLQRSRLTSRPLPAPHSDAEKLTMTRLSQVDEVHEHRPPSSSVGSLSPEYQNVTPDSAGRSENPHDYQNVQGNEEGSENPHDYQNLQGNEEESENPRDYQNLQGNEEGSENPRDYQNLQGNEEGSVLYANVRTDTTLYPALNPAQYPTSDEGKSDTYLTPIYVKSKRN